MLGPFAFPVFSNTDACDPNHSHPIYWTPQHTLQLELSNLLVRLRQWQQATTAINKCLERSRDGLPATENLQLDVEA